MLVELIPVIDADILRINPQDGDQDMQQYADENSSFIPIINVSYKVLSEVILRHTQHFRDGQLPWSECSPLFGGYLLQVNGSPFYFPQCCADLSDIHYWEELSGGRVAGCEGHPSPMVSFKNDLILLDFTVGPHDESFQPPPAGNKCELLRLALVNAVSIAKRQLHDFEQRLIRLNEQEEWGIENIGNILIWTNLNRKD